MAHCATRIGERSVEKLLQLRQAVYLTIYKLLRMTKKEKIEFIYEKLGYKCSIIDIMRYVESKGDHIVLGSNGLLLYSKKEPIDTLAVRYDLGNYAFLSLQKKEVIDLVYFICK